MEERLQEAGTYRDAVSTYDDDSLEYHIQGVSRYHQLTTIITTYNVPISLHIMYSSVHINTKICYVFIYMYMYLY